MTIHTPIDSPCRVDQKCDVSKFFWPKTAEKQRYSKNNENVTKIMIFFVKIVSDKNLRKTYEKITEFKTKINK